MRLAVLTSIFCLGVLTLSGCATRLPILLHKIGKEPDLEIVSQVKVGDTIYTDFDYIQSDGVRLINGFKYTYGRFDRIKINVEPGEFLFGYQFSNGTKEYCTNNPEINVCFLSSGDDVNFDKFRVIQTFKNKQNWMHSAHKIPFEKSEIGYIKGRTFELLYDGIANGVLRVTYREYVDSTARPAFYQEVNYELSPNGSTTIDFKGVEIEVLDASNNKITYKVIRGFRDR
jgi:hypothetical protein